MSFFSTICSASGGVLTLTSPGYVIELMKDNKRVVILVVIALILATTAILLNIMGSKVVPTTMPQTGDVPSGAIVGIEIQPALVEDRLIEENGVS